MTAPPLLPGRPLLLAFLSAALPACSSEEDDSTSFVPRSTTQAAVPTAPLVVSGDWMVYFASEAASGGVNLNGDGEVCPVCPADQVAFVVNLRSASETNLGVAAQGAVILGNEVFLRVAEVEDGRDWETPPDPVNKVVLLHWSAATGTPAFVDTLDIGLGFPDELPVAAGGRLYYAAAAGTLAGDETNLRYVSAAAPTMPTVVLNEAGAGALRTHLYGQSNGLILCSVDETVDMSQRNTDLDDDDEHVLFLLDGTDMNARLRNAGVALQSATEPFATRALGTSSWLVAFLVDEAGQGGTSLNDQGLFPLPNGPLLPGNCATNDMDAFDQVLHYLVADFISAVPFAPVNTGLAGHDRVLVLAGFVATITNEDDAGCNLNAATGDGDMMDDVARWVATTTPNVPAVDPNDLHALASSIGGGSMGLAVLDNRFVAVIDEGADGNADFDTQPGESVADHELVAWLDPAAANPFWMFSHQSANDAFGTGVFDSEDDSEPFAGASWMAAEAVGGRLGLVFLEEVPGTNPNIGSLNTNVDCNKVVKDNDKGDGLPVWADFEAGPTLDFDGLGFAVDQGNAGVEIAAGFAFFRVSENNDNRDYNGDGVLNDVVLFRNPLGSCGPILMATSDLNIGQAITTDRLSGAAFLADESQANRDFNGDGDALDHVAGYFHF